MMASGVVAGGQGAIGSCPRPLNFSLSENYSSENTNNWG